VPAGGREVALRGATVTPMRPATGRPGGMTAAPRRARTCPRYGYPGPGSNAWGPAGRSDLIRRCQAPTARHAAGSPGNLWTNLAGRCDRLLASAAAGPSPLPLQRFRAISVPHRASRFDPHTRVVVRRAQPSRVRCSLPVLPAPWCCGPGRSRPRLRATRSTACG
jgi:hypothetical protein